jgi:hypothetical protein
MATQDRGSVREELIHSDANALANAAFVECEDVRDFLTRQVRPLLDRVANTSDADATVHGAVLRVMAWMTSMGRLNDPVYFQVSLAGVRAIFEIAIDLALLHHDRANHTSAKIIAWERSALLAAAEKTARYYERSGKPVADEHEERLRFVEREGDRIRLLRRTTWPGRRDAESHPMRWTGRNLGDDARRAAAFGSYGFDAFYDLRYAEWCWGTHGSGLAGIRPIPAESFPGLAAFALHESARLALVAATLALNYFGLWDSIVAIRFEQLEKEISKHRALAYATQKGRLPPPKK